MECVVTCNHRFVGLICWMRSYMAIVSCIHSTCAAGKCDPAASTADASTGCACESGFQSVDIPIVFSISLDRSGSVGNEFQGARNAVADFIVDQASMVRDPPTQFYVNTFSSNLGARIPTTGPAPDSNDEVSSAVRVTAGPGGNTNMKQALIDLRDTMGPVCPDGVFCLAVLITDGVPTAGDETSAGLNLIADDIKTDVGQLAVLGIGSGINTALLTGLASKDLYYAGANFSQLGQLLTDLTDEICPLDIV